ncbi:LysE/ArgO family amino acid transporter [Rhodovibrio sodomensis]|uniref:LysE/ArgO family amino acid transporter n=1 Tax=Rhodovibrio sodomensis TaxID=1088 RepID=UPI001F5BD000|nr:LysE/ArgO family amino acid transporter [Rhodovibrio sodomensis]
MGDIIDSGLLPLLGAGWQGFGLGLGLIVAIGAQNAFVLRQGLRRQHVALVVALCTVCDSALITLGAAGVGTLVASSPVLTKLAVYGGAAFLIVYGALTLKNAFKPQRLNLADAPDAVSTRAIVTAALGFSILNPHAWLDTVVLLGGVAGQFPSDQRAVFTGGAILASAVWFVALGAGAAWLSPVLARPKVWRAIDLVIGLVLWTIAGVLLWNRGF